MLTATKHNMTTTFMYTNITTVFMTGEWAAFDVKSKFLTETNQFTLLTVFTQTCQLVRVTSNQQHPESVALCQSLQCTT